MTRLAPVVLILTAAFRAGAALAASDVGIPTGPVGDVPTETLPAGPEEAIVAPPGGGGDTALPRADLLYAYGELMVLDRNGEPVIDPKTHRPKTSGFCQLWKTDWLDGKFTFDVTGGRDWWTRVTMAVDKAGREIRILRVWGPNVLAVPGGGWKPAGPPDEIAYEGPNVEIVMPMRDAPEPGWPCPRSVWEAQLKAERWVVVETPGGGSGGAAGGGGMNLPAYRERQRQMACSNPQISGNLRVCHGY
jgi:hypothetical protein